MLELFEEHDPKVLFGELGVDQCESRALKGKVPRREPWILPLVGHCQDAHRVQVSPVLIADELTRVRRRKFAVISFEPEAHVEKIALLAPEHPSEGLALNHPFFVISAFGMNGFVELVGLSATRLEDGLDVLQRLLAVIRCKAQK